MSIPFHSDQIITPADYVDVHGDQEYTLNVTLSRLNRVTRDRDRANRAYTPRFPKIKDEGWILILGEIFEIFWYLKPVFPADVAHNELIALKRISCVRGRPTNVQLVK